MDDESKMLQLIDAVETYEHKDFERAKQVIKLICKRPDGKIQVINVRNFKHEMFVAVPDDYPIEAAKELVGLANEHMLKYQPPCRRTGCECYLKESSNSSWGWKKKKQSNAEDDTSLFTNVTKAPEKAKNKPVMDYICTHACRLDRLTDKKAIEDIDFHYANGYFGKEFKLRKFLNVKLTRSYYANDRLCNFLMEKIDDSSLKPVHRGCYEIEPKCIDSFLRGQRHYGYQWLYAANGKPVPLELCPKKNLINRDIYFDIETPYSGDEFPTPEIAEIGCIGCVTSEDNKGYMFICAGKETREVVWPDSKEMAPNAEPFPEPEIRIFNTEVEMLIAFYNFFMEYNPDRMIGYNSNMFDLPFILKRMKLRGLPQWCQWGRLDSEPVRMIETRMKNRDVVQFTIPGRVCIDGYVSACNDFSIEVKSKTLKNVCKALGIREKIDMPVEEIHPSFNGSAEKRGQLAFYCMTDVYCTKEFAEKKNIGDMNIAYCKQFKILPQHEVDRGVSYKLLRNLYSVIWKRFLIPHMPYDQATNGRALHPSLVAIKREMRVREEGYQGGLVLKKRFNVRLQKKRGKMILDFKSLYPSVIREKNICPTTVIIDLDEAKEMGLVEGVDYERSPGDMLVDDWRPPQKIMDHFKEKIYYKRLYYCSRNRLFFSKIKNYLAEHNNGKTAPDEETPNIIVSGDMDDEIEAMIKAHEDENFGAAFMCKSKGEGVLPGICTHLMDARDDIKKKMKNFKEGSYEHGQLDRDQAATKMATNAVYGNAGMSKGKTSCVCVADAITGWGRWFLVNSKEYIAQAEDIKHLHPVVGYGDTDSLFVEFDINMTPEEIKVSTLIDRVKQIADGAALIHASVNGKSGFHNKIMIMQNDGIFMELIMLQKKMYFAAMLKYEPGKPVKVVFKKMGASFLKDDAIPYVAVTGHHMIDIMLSTEKNADDGRTTAQKTEEAYEYVRERYAKLLVGEIDADDIKFSIKLSKGLDDYAQGKKPPPHVIAGKMLRKSGEKIVAGDVITYMFCYDLDGNNVPIPLKLVGNSKVNYQYYGERFAKALGGFARTIFGKDRADELFNVNYYRRALPLGRLFGAEFAEPTRSMKKVRCDSRTMEEEEIIKEEEEDDLFMEEDGDEIESEFEDNEEDLDELVESLMNVKLEGTKKKRKPSIKDVEKEAAKARKNREYKQSQKKQMTLDFLFGGNKS